MLELSVTLGNPLSLENLRRNEIHITNSRIILKVIQTSEDLVQDESELSL